MSDKIGQNKFGIYNCKVCNFENKPGLYSCKVCDYITSHNSQYIRHIATSKHKRLTNAENIGTKTSKTYICDCKKEYKHRQTLFNHKKKCNYKAIDTNSEIIQLLKQNIELHKSLIELSI